VVTQGGITMRKFLTILLILIYTAVYTPVFAAITTQTSTISKIENVLNTKMKVLKTELLDLKKLYTAKHLPEI